MMNGQKLMEDYSCPVQDTPYCITGSQTYRTEKPPEGTRGSIELMVWPEKSFLEMLGLNWNVPLGKDALR
eukprot:7418262-Ditylum_brightwellii.AAC.1